jgi:hypothetical protein
MNTMATIKSCARSSRISLSPPTSKGACLRAVQRDWKSIRCFPDPPIRIYTSHPINHSLYLDDDWTEVISAPCYLDQEILIAAGNFQCYLIYPEQKLTCMLDSDTTTWPSLPRTMNSFSQILYGAFRSSKRVLYALQSLVPICILFLILILRIYIPGTYPEPAFQINISLHSSIAPGNI